MTGISLLVALTVMVQHGFQENGHVWCTEISQHR
jgi:hypothetical protein